MRRIVLCLLLCFTACKQTPDGERARYQAARDRIGAVATKNPAMKADISAKLAEFDAAFKAADGKSGDAQIAALSALNDRVANYERAITPGAPDASAASKLGSKLNPASQPASQPSKLAAPPPASQPSKLAPPPPPPASQPAGSGFGGGGAPPPPSKLAPASQPAGSGFGGKAPDAPTKSGFGGK
jgi:hypothetical protein